MRLKLAVVLWLVQSSAVYGLSTDVVRCRKAIAGATHALTNTTLSSHVVCHKQRMLGQLDAAVDCNSLGDPGFPATRLSRIIAKAAKLASRIDNSCDGLTPASLGYTQCASPCDVDVPALDTMQQVGECLSCLAEHHAATVSDALYGASPPVTATRSADWQCQNTYVGSAGASYLAKRLSRQRACQYKIDRGTAVGLDCHSDDTSGALARALTQLDARIARCSDVSLASLSSCGVAVSAEQSCVATHVDTAANILFDAIYPVPPPTPTATALPSNTVTNTPTITRTPTITGTPTATASITPTSQCPSSNFLNLSGAPGAGAGYPTPSLTVSCTSTTVNVHGNGIPPYTFVQTTPNALQAQNYNFAFPLHPAVAASTTKVPLLGNIGVAVNGLPLYGPNEAQMPDPYGDPVANAILDECLGHTGFGGAYHYHAALVKCLSSTSLVARPWENADPPTDVESPVVAYAFDGFPIYGPYECSDVECTSVREMLSSWDNVGYSAATVGCSSSAACSSTQTCATVMINGTAQNACVPKTCAWSNNQYVGKSATQYLDQCNGHVGPKGDYHYHATTTFPYLLGCYRGTPTTNGGSGTPPGGTCS